MNLDTHFSDKPIHRPVSLLATLVDVLEDSFVTLANQDTDFRYAIPDYLMYLLHIGKIDAFMNEFDNMIMTVLMEHIIGSFMALYNAYKADHQKICKEFGCYRVHDRVDLEMKVEFCDEEYILDEFITNGVKVWADRHKK